MSKDGTWKLWDIDGESVYYTVTYNDCHTILLHTHTHTVRYNLNESPKLLHTVPLPDKGTRSIIALSPDAKVVAVSCHTSLHLYLSSTGTLAQSLPDVHRGE